MANLFLGLKEFLAVFLIRRALFVNLLTCQTRSLFYNNKHFVFYRLEE